jgi:hypothetical protein
MAAARSSETTRGGAEGGIAVDRREIDYLAARSTRPCTDDRER